MKPRNEANNLFWPIALLAILPLCALFLAGNALIRSFDASSVQREQVVVAHGLEARVSEVAHMVVPQTVWDDAVLHLDNRFDPDWAQSNILEYLAQSGGFERIYILDPDDNLLMGTDGGAVYSALFAPIRDLLIKVRANEAKRVATGQFIEGETLRNPIQASSIASVNGRLMIVSATLVQPDFGQAIPKGPRAPVVITAMAINGPFLETFGERFMLDGLVAVAGVDPVDEGLARVSLHDSRSVAIGMLLWSPRHPGAVLWREIGPWIGAAFFILLALTYFLFRRSHRMAEGLVASEARASHLAYHDALTGLANRVHFSDRLALALNGLRRSGRPIALICLDLDRFKDVNDTYGHQVGDELIKEAARRMAAECRTTDTIARLSGDEFAIVCHDIDQHSAAQIAERLCAAVAEPFQFGPARLFVGCSIGIALITDNDMDPAEALRLADIALYRTKESRKGHYCFFEPEMDAAIRKRRNIESDLRAAMQSDQLRLVYQPQVDNRGSITGVEALLRWDHPVRGNVPPAYFVPIAEQCGLILELGLFALARAFEDSRRWPGLKVAVNVSASQIRDKNFVTQITLLAAEKGVLPSQFDLEITEGILLGDDPDTHQRLAELRKLGFGLALDDFGTGYSSLNYLHRYPINSIKIDRSFVADLGVEDESEAVISAIVKMARALKLGVIAEGVETEHQVQHLSNAGCTGLQGYLYSRPVEADAIDAMLETPERMLTAAG